MDHTPKSHEKVKPVERVSELEPRSLSNLEYDLNFGEQGKLKLPFDPPSGSATRILKSTFRPGHFFVAYEEPLRVTNPNDEYAARLACFDKHGILDVTYGKSGVIDINFPPLTTIGAKGASHIHGVHESDSGELFIWGVLLSVVGGLITRTRTDLVISKYFPDGLPDKKFGMEGSLYINEVLDFETIPFNELSSSCLINAEGDFYITTTRRNSDKNYLESIILKFSSAGELDEGFQDNAVLVMAHSTSPDDYLIANGMVQTPDNAILVSGFIDSISDNNSPDPAPGVLMKYDHYGNKDLSFGENGVKEVWAGIHRIKLNLPHISTTLDKITLTGQAIEKTVEGTVSKSFISANDFNGEPVKDFNGGVPVILSIRGEQSPKHDIWSSASHQLNTDKVLTVGNWGFFGPDKGPAVGRFNPDGTPDERLVPGGTFGTLPDAEFSAEGQQIFINTDPHQILVAGTSAGVPVVLALKV